MPRPLLDPVITPVGVARCPWKRIGPFTNAQALPDFNANALTHIANAASGSDPVETLNGTATGHFILGERLANAYAHQFMFIGRHSTAVAGKSCEIRGWLLSQLQVPQALSNNAEWCEWIGRPAFEIKLTSSSPVVLSTANSKIISAAGQHAFIDDISITTSHLPAGDARVNPAAGVPACLEVAAAGADYLALAIHNDVGSGGFDDVCMFRRHR